MPNTAVSTITPRRRFRGSVVSIVGIKTTNVLVERRFRHPKLRRVVRRTRKFLAHDEKGDACLGDIVVIEETRPLSRRKRWQVVEVVKRSFEEKEGGE